MLMSTIWLGILLLVTIGAVLVVFLSSRQMRPADESMKGGRAINWGLAIALLLILLILALAVFLPWLMMAFMHGPWMWGMMMWW